MKVIVVIPARYSSTRLPGKVLLKDTGKFLIQHTYEQACLAKLPEKVVIAADDDKIVEAAKSFGAECILTSVNHQSGTDRIAEVVKKLNTNDYSLTTNFIVVNVQGDEPEIDPENIDKVAKLLIDNPDYPMATLVAPFEKAEDVANPNIVKVVLASCVECDVYHEKMDSRLRGNDNTQNSKLRTQNLPERAIYFSRSPIPYDRQTGGIGNVNLYLRHIGIYAYRKDFLLKITTLPQTTLEKTEKLEQLRAIENGYGILVAKVKRTNDGIDTPEQYAEFVKRYKKV